MPTINFFVISRFMVAENVIATANNIMADQLLFRIGIVTEIIIAALAIVFAITLYIILKSVNKNLALLAFSFKLAEAILLAVVALGHFIALLILNELTSLTVFEPEQVQALVGLFINLYFYVGAIGLVFHGLNSTVFLYLMFISKYVPGILAGFGLIPNIRSFKVSELEASLANENFEFIDFECLHRSLPQYFIAAKKM